MKIFLTSDTHWGHKNIIGFCGRPFPFVRDMDETFIRNWNAVVSSVDHVYHVGDCSYYKDAKTAEILRSLNGTIFLVPGNHDTPKRFGALSKELAVVLPPLCAIEVEGRLAVLCHLPLEAWRVGRHSIVRTYGQEIQGKPRNVLHFHGHTHGNSRKVPLRLDVGVDVWNYAPVEFSVAVTQAEADFLGPCPRCDYGHVDKPCVCAHRH